MRVELDEPKCVAFLLTSSPGAGQPDEVREAVAICPAAAIRVVES
jgi:hypothetical protein